MVETLLSSSQVLLFGLPMEDIQIVDPVIVPPETKRVYLATTRNIDIRKEIPDEIDGQSTLGKKYFLLAKQREESENGYYRYKNKKLSIIYPPKNFPGEGNIERNMLIYVRHGRKNGRKLFLIVPNYKQNGDIESVAVTNQDQFDDKLHSPFSGKRNGLASEIQQQIMSDNNPIIARIYGFSYEGYYYELPRPVMFLVHGDGLPASEARGRTNRARAPGEPSRTGLGEADFQFSDDILVWSYDKADYTIRMDVETGMFEDVLLAAMLGGSGGFDSAGMNARGMNARGMNARGMNARGMNARGMNARGGGNSD